MPPFLTFLALVLSSVLLFGYLLFLFLLMVLVFVAVAIAWPLPFPTSREPKVSIFCSFWHQAAFGRGNLCIYVGSCGMLVPVYSLRFAPSHRAASWSFARASFCPCCFLTQKPLRDLDTTPRLCDKIVTMVVLNCTSSHGE